MGCACFYPLWLCGGTASFDALYGEPGFIPRPSRIQRCCVVPVAVSTSRFFAWVVARDVQCLVSVAFGMSCLFVRCVWNVRVLPSGLAAVC